MIAIVIPTLDREQAEKTGRLALASAGCEARLIVVDGPARGFTKTVNEGLAQLEDGEDVCILNDDVIGFPVGWLRALRAGLYANKRYGIAGPSGKSSTRPACEGKPGMTGLQAVDQVSFWCALLRRECLDVLGHLDERFIHYGSDNEFCHRARKRGWRSVWVKGVYLEHQHHGSGIRNQWWKQDRALLKRVVR
jgi:hypothetical protein